MDSLVKSDIFFFITTLVMIAVGVVLVIAVIYVIKILKDVRYMSGRAKEETDRILGEFEGWRGVIAKFFAKPKRSRKKTSTNKK